MFSIYQHADQRGFAQTTGLNASLEGSVVLSHPGCPQFAQHAARALDEASLLKAYVTTFSYQPETYLSRTLRLGLSQETTSLYPNWFVTTTRLVLND